MLWIFSLEHGELRLTIPAGMNGDEVQDVCEFLELVKRTIRRPQPSAVSAPSSKP